VIEAGGINVFFKFKDVRFRKILHGPELCEQCRGYLVHLLIGRLSGQYGHHEKLEGGLELKGNVGGGEGLGEDADYLIGTFIEVHCSKL